MVEGEHALTVALIQLCKHGVGNLLETSMRRAEGAVDEQQCSSRGKPLPVSAVQGADAGFLAPCRCEGPQSVGTLAGFPFLREVLADRADQRVQERIDENLEDLAPDGADQAALSGGVFRLRLW